MKKLLLLTAAMVAALGMPAWGQVAETPLQSVALAWERGDYTSALAAYLQGVPGKVIAQIMGHAKVDTTLNIYTQVLDGSLKTAADRVGSELFTIVHKPDGAADVTH